MTTESYQTPNESPLLVVILDIYAALWDDQWRACGQNPIPSMTQMFDALLVFLHAQVLLRPDLRLAVLMPRGDFSGRAFYVYPSSEPTDEMVFESTPGLANHVSALDRALIQSVRREAERLLQSLDQDSNIKEPISIVSSALAFALCYIHRHTKPSITAAALASFVDASLTATEGDGASSAAMAAAMQTTAPNIEKGVLNINGTANTKESQLSTARILVVSNAMDATKQYVPLMNTIFSAQRQEIPVDVLQLGGSDASVFLTQASYLTHGLFVHLKQFQNLMAYLMTVFQLDARSRAAMPCPVPESVDLRAACFCHQQLVDKAFVCSVCLAIFCEKSSECVMCGTAFESHS